jgi:hypothetical protein
MPRMNWLDEKSETTLIDDYARNMESFVDAMADGKIDDHELEKQENRLVELMKEVEPSLDDATHEKMTQLLCEMSAYSAMSTLHAIWQSRPKTTFRG